MNCYEYLVSPYVEGDYTTFGGEKIKFRKLIQKLTKKYLTKVTKV